MSFYTYKNTRVLINNSGFVVSDAQINLQAALSPSYLSNKRHSNDYRATDGIGGVFSCSYYLTGVDPLKEYLGNEIQVISGNFGGLYFNSGYLRSYSITCPPNRSIFVTADIVFFDELKGEFSPTYQSAPETNFLNVAYASVQDPTNGNIGNIGNINNLSFNFNADIQPSYRAGETTPYRVLYGQKELSAVITFDNLSGDLPVSGREAGVTLNFAHPHIASISEFLKVSGKLYQRVISSAVGDLTKSTISIKQNYITNPPVITSFTASAAPGSRIQILGSNLSQVGSILIGGVDTTVVPVSDTEVSGVVPLDAVSGLLTVTNHGGSTFSTTNFVPSHHPITISGILPITGSISGSVRLSGTNFYRISHVLFNSGVSSSFQVLSPSMIQATVPLNAAWGKVWVISDERGISGLSVQNFVPIPKIERFTPVTGNTGETVIIQGYGFSGITGVLFNNLPNINPFTTTFRVLSNTGISGVVPTGNFRGRITLLGQSGVRVSSTTDFGAYITITGLSPSRARTGDAIEILGSNFYSDILYKIPNTTNSFLVSFGGGDITGHFIRVNANRLTGLVPYNAKSGAVYLYDPDLNPYASTGSFRLRHHPPTITTTGTETGFFSGYAVIEGSNFFEVSSVKLSGTTGTLTIPNSQVSTSQLGDILAFQYPVATGGYYHLIVSTPEGDVTGYSGVFIRDVPVRYAITPSSGAIGALITFSGRNIYPDSKVYFNTTGVEATTLTGSIPTGYDSIQFYVPVLARTGYNDIILYNQYGWVTGISGVRLIQAPGISGFNPTSGAFGDSVSISGSWLGNATGVYFGTGRATTFTKIGETGITAIVPTGAYTDYISVYYNGGYVKSTGIFQILSPAPTIGHFAPPSGYWGDTVSISGSNLNYVNYVIFSGVTGEAILSNSSFSIVGSTGITVSVPDGAKTGPLKVRTDRVTASSSNNFIIIPTPVISIFTPNTGILGATVRVSGANLSGCTFYFTNINTGRYVLANNVTVVNTTGATFTVPREIVNGPILISGFGRLFNGTTGSFYPLPTIKAFAPTTAATGTTITISGINAANTFNVFATGDGLLESIVSGSLSINYSQISGVGIVNPSTGHTVISFTLNQNFAGTGALLLINSYFSTATTSAGLRNSPMISGINVNTYTGNINITQAAPIITNFTPTKGNQNTLVTLNGLHLSKTTGVYLVSGSTQSLCTLLSSGQQQITFYPPNTFAPRSGQFAVYTSFGNTTSTNYFTYIQNLHMSGMFPTQDITGNWIKISGSGIQDVTGLYFNNYSAPFTINLVGTVYELSGIIPMVNENIARGYQITLMSEAGTYIHPNQFIIRPGPTQIWGPLSGKEKIYTTGIELKTGDTDTGYHILMCGNYEIESGKHYTAYNSYVNGIKVRMFTICATGV